MRAARAGVGPRRGTRLRRGVVSLGLAAVALAGAVPVRSPLDPKAWAAGPLPSPESANPVWAALRGPGAVVVLRHSFAPGGFDPPGARLDDCTTQRNLDASGRAQARRIGEAFRRQGIRVGHLRSSPRCRCLDTGRLAFEREPEAWDALQGALDDAGRRARQVAEIRLAIGAHEDGPPLVLVTHGSVVTDLTGLDVQMGELVVLSRDATGHHVVVGRLYVD